MTQHKLFFSEKVRFQFFVHGVRKFWTRWRKERKRHCMRANKKDPNFEKIFFQLEMTFQNFRFIIISFQFKIIYLGLAERNVRHTHTHTHIRTQTPYQQQQQ